MVKYLRHFDIPQQMCGKLLTFECLRSLLDVSKSVEKVFLKYSKRFSQNALFNHRFFLVLGVPTELPRFRLVCVFVLEWGGVRCYKILSFSMGSIFVWNFKGHNYICICIYLTIQRKIFVLMGWNFKKSLMVLWSKCGKIHCGALIPRSNEIQVRVHYQFSPVCWHPADGGNYFLKWQPHIFSIITMTS